MTEPRHEESAVCHHCGSKDLETAPGYAALHRVTSDCKPWPPGGGLGRCRACGMVQALITAAWHAEADAIYRAYTIYHQSGGSEQHVFDARHGVGRPRSMQIVQALRDQVSLPGAGRLLDIGCGNGSFLSAWSRSLPEWTLAGTEVSDKYRAEVEAIPGVERLYTGDFQDVPGLFDVVSLVHVLEHVPSPAAFLRRLQSKLKPGGLLFVEVPDCALNPFMLLVADHCSHFSPGLLGGVLKATGLESVKATHAWVAKEVSATARRGEPDPQRRPGGIEPLPSDESRRVFEGWRVLEKIVRQVETLANRRPFGLFGTAIAATWLDAQTNRAAVFFVDEDPNRAGRTHLDRPILTPENVPRGATVFVALPQPLAGEVADRLKRLDLDLFVAVP